MNRRPFFVGLAAVTAIVGTGLCVQAAFDAEKQSAPPHRVRPVAATGPLPLSAVGGESLEVEVAAIGAWVEGEQRAAWFAGVAEAEMADLARRSAVRSSNGSSSEGAAPARSGVSGCGDDWDCFRECTIDHESRTSGVYGAVSPGGTYRGAFQYLGSTWRNVSVNAGYGEWADTPVDQVPADVQDAVARFHWEHSGTQPWGGRCG